MYGALNNVDCDGDPHDSHQMYVARHDVVYGKHPHHNGMLVRDGYVDRGTFLNVGRLGARYCDDDPTQNEVHGKMEYMLQHDEVHLNV